MNNIKYKIKDNKIVNRVTGENIPEDEPVFILRAKDCNALATLIYYRNQCSVYSHRMALDDCVQDFVVFSQQQMHRMKEPDTAQPIKTLENPMKSILDQEQHKRRQYVISQIQQLHDWMVSSQTLAIAECTEEEIGQALEMLKDAFPEQPSTT